MRKLVLTLAAVSGLSLNMPAAAQHATDLQLKIRQLRTSMQIGISQRTITQAEAAPLRERLRELVTLEREFRFDGYTAAERESLQEKMAVLRAEIRRARTTNINCPPDLVVKKGVCARPVVGDHYSANWPAVPARYGKRYRDTRRFYYRFDNVDRIYQVDRRTNRIVRITRL